MGGRIALNNMITDPILHFIFYLFCTILTPLIATTLCDYFSKEAEGSGIPELKTYLSGLRVNSYVSFKSYAVKSIGQSLMDGSLFGIGKEGPFIQLSAMISNFISMAPWFLKLRKTSFYRNQILVISVAAGVAATFGTAFGGMLFAIEVCTSVFLISNQWRAFVCSLLVKMVYTIFVPSTGGFNNFLILNDANQLNLVQHGLAIGIFCGWFASFWVYLFCQLQYFKATTKRFAFVRNRYIWVPMVSTVMTFMLYWLPNSVRGPKLVLEDLIYRLRLSDLSNFWTENTTFTILFYTFITRYIGALLFATCPLPNGIFLPSLIIGALFGRMWGQFVQIDSSEVDARYFACMGAAAFAASVTRTTSVALIIIEMTEQSKNFMAIQVAVAAAYGTSNIFTMSFFDTVLAIKKLPYMPIQFEPHVYNNLAGEVCEKFQSNLFLKKECTILDMLLLINQFETVKIDDYIPIVKNTSQFELQGAVRVYDCLEYLSQVGKVLVNEFSRKKKLQDKISNFRDKIAFENVFKLEGDMKNYKRIAKISDDFHDFINRLKKNEKYVDYNEDRKYLHVKQKLTIHPNASFKEVQKNLRSHRSLEQKDFENMMQENIKNLDREDSKKSFKRFSTQDDKGNEKQERISDRINVAGSQESPITGTKKDKEEEAEVDQEKQPMLQKNLISTISNDGAEVRNNLLDEPKDNDNNEGEQDNNAPGPSNRNMPSGSMAFLTDVFNSLSVDWNVEKLKFNPSPTSVHMNVKLMKVHYMFQMLGVGTIFVVDSSNNLIGKLTRESFLNLRHLKKN